LEIKTGEGLGIEFNEIKIINFKAIEKEICLMKSIYKVLSFNLNQPRFKMFL